MNTVIITFKFFCIIFLLSMFFISCEKKNISHFLEKDLIGYRKSRGVNVGMLDGYYIKKFAFKKQDSTTYHFIFQLSDDTVKDTIEKYGLGMVFYADEKYIDNERGYIMQQTKPYLETYGNHKYIIENIIPPAPYLDSLHIYLSGRERYTGVIGKMIRLNNIKLE